MTLTPANPRPVDGHRPIPTALRPELAWATDLRLTGAQRHLLHAVNDWLRRTDGGNAPIAAAAERAFQLLGDEKAFDHQPPRGGATLWAPGRLTLELLRCRRNPTPLVWEPVNTIPNSPQPVVGVENHATFRTLLTALRERPDPRWAAVIWTQGRNTAPLKSLTELPFTVIQLDYLGDLDLPGLTIAAAACAAAERSDIPAGPALHLWELLLDQPSRPDRPVRLSEARKATAWLPPATRPRACEVLCAGRAIPQEALRLEILRNELNSHLDSPAAPGHP
ncbi:hypothetical protein BIV57_05200 [Mangrovactinospora gilvigrisea]|uniref:Wadjet protein JetD C-terminal domain-containing protein n=1 Tax=Mangrovactinospora gilvigrisea TaxID=1428644 RepID=A0A1J7CAI9_9ACTN|nr:hypothetical protein BIV57_05200 [Mangrovactinospora gilvigrisea]